MLSLIVCLSAVIGISCGSPVVAKDGSVRQTWGYATVRPGANMFWWLYYTTASEQYATKPLVLWLQGGPGASGTGFGNFVEIGPLDVQQVPRSNSWVHHVNVLFVDSPVGSGFSYVDSPDLLVRNNSAIAKDLLSLLHEFVGKLPEFESTPFYIFSESYGGKMAVELARQLFKEISSEKIKLAFKGIALGDSWISPVDSVNSWATYLLDLGLVDTEGFTAVANAAKKVAGAVADGNFTLATDLWGKAEDIVDSCSANVNFYNVLSPVKSDVSSQRNDIHAHLFNRHIQHQEWRQGEDDLLAKLMNGAVKQMLRIVPANVTWGGQSSEVFTALSDDFMQPVTQTVETLLNYTQLSVNVYSGQLDLVVATTGTLKWVQDLRWAGAKPWSKSSRSPLLVNGIIQGYKKSFKNFAFYWISRAGHMVPADNPEAALELLKTITKCQKL